MKDRIRSIMESDHLSQKDFAEKLKISASTLSGIFTGRSAPSNKVIQAIHVAYPTINIEWLMWGVGSMYSSVKINSVSGNDDRHGISVPPRMVEGENVVGKPATDINLTAGDLFAPNSVAIPSEPAPKIITETKIIKRSVKEIRIFYDDGTYESFIAGN